MLFRAPTLLVAAFFAGSIMARTCNPGEYRGSDNKCHDCADGYVSPNNPPSSGQYSCVPCPAGQDSNPAHTQCQKCSPGHYNDVPGGTCRKCAPGYFSNVSGAKSCCQCCAGFYDNNPRTHCNKCPASRPYSFPGSDSNDDCVKGTDRSGQPDRVDKCDMDADNVCPNPTGGGPVGSPVTRKKRTGIHCTKGLQSCPNFGGNGYECVDTRNDPESCGGCVSLDGTGSGTDCTALDGVSVSRCVKGSCVIDSCSKGYAVSADGSSCNPLASTDGSSPQAFGSQQLGATARRIVRGARAAFF